MLSGPGFMGEPLLDEKWTVVSRSQVSDEENLTSLLVYQVEANNQEMKQQLLL
jgi:hypothetical protein